MFTLEENYSQLLIPGSLFLSGDLSILSLLIGSFPGRMFTKQWKMFTELSIFNMIKQSASCLAFQEKLRTRYGVFQLDSF